ncbi:MAG: chemotaxis response regulator protein-glutamate methylesterase [Tepidibacter sp.]|jgi:two-component system chemotaxis response regulator CheB|uniref:protein-glutamate methylesterase/protein-glutamine glutaminase n=1 Tax=Tepidibacter sp. TaxID=2529387 RepID=UPI0025EFD56F|nr:chemotaxis response regulator protein-glutamate methylesterase [Tepidibacter sp.]MCT4507978.1 chemotaxis response regulator protein-glutamate methylesterase [Tepidibacter sp.]
MKKIKVLIVDDSAFIRKLIKDILSSDEEIEVVDFAKNGKEAIEKLMKNEIDVVTLDVEMPLMDGIDTLKQIMIKKPTSVVMLSSLTKNGADLTIKALELGAVDFITKPSNIFKINNDDMKNLVIDKVKVASTVKSYNKNYTKKIKTIDKVKNNINKSFSKKDNIDSIVAIATSTGGPRALQNVVTDLSSDINSPVVIVQHMPAGFTKSLANRLDNMSSLHVKEAEDGELLRNNTIYIAPGNRHMKFKKERTSIRIILDDGEKISGHKPSADAMFYSLSEIDIKKIIAVVMTGMGSDGSKGLKKLKESKNNIISIAEDESTCVVFGMPKSVINLGLADKVIPINYIGKEINKLMGRF